MAAIDPTATPEHTGTTNGDTRPRATLKIIFEPTELDDDEDSEGSEDENYLNTLLQAGESEDDENEDDSSSDEEEKNGGPSDPLKTKKARKQAAVEQVMKALAESNSDDEMEVDGASGPNGVLSKAKKGKAKATDEDEESSDEENTAGLEGMEEQVLCTLDPTKVCAYSQNRKYVSHAYVL